MNNNMYNSKNRIPGIGMRIIKSAIGIFLCFLIDYFRGSSGIVFYSQLAVLWCIRDYVSETKKYAIQRTIGTVIGAVYGLIVIIGKGFVINNYSFLDSISAGDTYGFYDSIVYGLVVSIVIIFVLYTTVLLKQKQASYFSCVVFLSIVINHMSDSNPYLFVWNRFLDTMIGIIIGVMVNCINFHKYNRQNMLFLSGIDDTLLSPLGEVSAYSRVELNRMIENGIKFTVSTIRTPASLLDPMRGINLKLPVIAMDGAALYNIADNSYEKVYVISQGYSFEIQEYLISEDIDFFTNVVMDDVLLIYYRDSNNSYYNELIKKLRKSPYRNYIKKNDIVEHEVVYFMIIDTIEKNNKLLESFKNQSIFDDLKVTVTNSAEIEGCSQIKIYNKNATKENMVDYLKEKLDVEKIVTFGTIENRYTYTIEPGDFNRVVRLIKKDAYY